MKLLDRLIDRIVDRVAQRLNDRARESAPRRGLDAGAVLGRIQLDTKEFDQAIARAARCGSCALARRS